MKAATRTGLAWRRALTRLPNAPQTQIGAPRADRDAGGIAAARIPCAQVRQCPSTGHRRTSELTENLEFGVRTPGQRASLVACTDGFVLCVITRTFMQSFTC